MTNRAVYPVCLVELIAVILVAAIVTCQSAPARAVNAQATQEIDFLIDAVADSGCTFIRNGKEHTGIEASEHLQMKRKRGKRYFTNAEEFIDRLASKSSWSGKNYLIRCGSKPLETAAAWFTKKLHDYREQAR